MATDQLSAANVPSYPMTPVDCLLSDLTAIAEQSYDEAMYEDFVERLRQWRLEKEQFDA